MKDRKIKCVHCGKMFFIIGTNTTKINILSELKKGKKNISELARVVGIAYKNMHRHLNELEEGGFIKKEYHNQHLGQPVFNFLTKKGKNILLGGVKIK